MPSRVNGHTIPTDQQLKVVPISPLFTVTIKYKEYFYLGYGYQI